MDAGKLVARLRTERGITQQKLAQSLGKATSTVVRVEHNTGTWSQATARQVFEILQQSLPFVEEDAFSFLDHFGLSRTLYVAAPLPPSAQAPRGKSTSETHPIGTQIAEASTLFGQLLEKFGLPRSIEILKEALTQDVGYIDPDQVLSVHYPPRPSPTVPGAVESQHVTYSRKPASKSAPAIKRIAAKDRRQS